MQRVTILPPENVVTAHSSSSTAGGGCGVAGWELVREGGIVGEAFGPELALCIGCGASKEQLWWGWRSSWTDGSKRSHLLTAAWKGGRVVGGTALFWYKVVEPIAKDILIFPAVLESIGCVHMMAIQHRNIAAPENPTRV